MTQLEQCRAFFAELITASVGVSERGGRLAAAFAATPRERFVGKGPWRVFAAAGYVQTPSDDPVFLYQDIVVALVAEAGINNGQPTLHAASLTALKVQQGETVIHIGAGTGYYTAVLARLTGPVHGYEVHEGLARQAVDNVADLPHVRIVRQSGGNRRSIAWPAPLAMLTTMASVTMPRTRRPASP